ncbi:hypothetical protein [Paenibacillus macerans]|uniref:hypothetical protein n=1 Tax=Paenibacillus macerans TaxID=44252 RepID=UPI003D31F1BD
MNVVAHFRDGSRGMELASFREIELTKQCKRYQLRGFFMDYRKNRFGIVATPDGPVFFGNGQFYPLKEQPFQFWLRRQKGRIGFRFEWNGEIKLRFSYSRVLYRNGQAWEADEVRDFCCWLVEAAKKNNFYDFHTTIQ